MRIAPGRTRRRRQRLALAQGGVKLPGRDLALADAVIERLVMRLRPEAEIDDAAVARPLVGPDRLNQVPRRVAEGPYLRRSPVIS